MLTRARIHSFVAAGLLTLLALPLQAQLNPKWQTNNSPDFLDLFQRSTGQYNKPEIVTVLDFTGSMGRGMYHSSFSNIDSADADGGSNLTFTRSGSGTVASPYLVTGSLSVGAGNYPYGTGTAYTAFNLTGGTLIRPDGTALTAALINTNYVNANYLGTSTPLPGENAATKAADVRNWIRSASHVRFTRSGRTLDMPISWTILDDFSVQPNIAAGEYRKMYNTYPLKMTIQDPVTGTEVEMDTNYRISGTSQPISNSATLPLTSTTLSYPTAFYGRSYMHWLWNSTPQPIANAGSTYYAFNYPVNAAGIRQDIPGRNRAQAVKDAFLRTWVKYYNKVFWATRFINNTAGSSGTMENSRGSTLNADSRGDFPSGDPLTSVQVGGRQRGWQLLNSNSLLGMQKIAAYFPSGGTPLTYAMANAMAQFNDPNSVFNDVEYDSNTVGPTDPGYDISKDNRPKECMNHFLLLFTDGQPNSDGGPTQTGTWETTPYMDSSLRGSASAGNAAIQANRASMNPNGTTHYWGVANLAGVAAHGADPSALITSRINFGTRPYTLPPAGTNYTPPVPSYPTSGDATSENWLPFWIQGRGKNANYLRFQDPHPIQTMTIGVSLGGNLTDTNSGKRRLFMAAAFGDPERRWWDNANHAIDQKTPPTTKFFPDLNNLTAFAVDGNGEKTDNSVFFFDAADPSQLVKYLDKAFMTMSGMANINSTTSPVLPTMGTGLGAAVYLGKFKPADKGGPVWGGDLLMYPVKEDSNGVTRLLDSLGAPLDGDDLAVRAKARWAASVILETKGWQNRVIYSRVPATSGTPNPPMTRIVVSASDTYSSITDPGYTTIKAHLTGTDSTKFDNWRFYIGARMSGPSPLATRNESDDGQGLMGDIVNSTPAILDYSSLPSTVTSTVLTDAYTDHAGEKPRFRMIFVGTNQGMLHAFGEVSWTDSGTGIQNGVADELWAFAPTDLLPYIGYYRTSTNAHRFGVDGSPTVYLLDLPTSNSVRGNGYFDVSPAAKERALVIFGLGKGGRSYYAIDVRDPAGPVFQENNATYGVGMGWSLCPDESFNYPSARFKGPAASASPSVITKMGLSTSVPTLGRMVATSSKLVTDLVFLGGGFSITEIENNLPASPAAPPNQGTKLGRSVVVLDAKGGDILGVWDLSATSGVGPIASGIVPYTFFRGSGFNQRAYFADYFGGVWGLGYQDFDANGLRMDSSYLDDWSTTVRPIYKQSPTEGLVSTLPVPFAVPGMPIRTTAPLMSPAAVGIAFVTGDRNNPLDRYYSPTWVKPTQHRVNVIFDRQDSYLLGLDTSGIAGGGAAPKVANASSLSTDQRNPAHSDFYLKNYYGYYINFPATATFVPKGLNSPMLLNGRLFYSYFNPTTSNPCSGGTGDTTTFRIQNVMLPDPTAADAPDAYHSGRILVWTGVASPFSIRSIMTGMQAGMSGGSGTNNNPNGTQNLQAQTLDTGSSDIYAKPRVWRTVH